MPLPFSFAELALALLETPVAYPSVDVLGLAGLTPHPFLIDIFAVDCVESRYSVWCNNRTPPRNLEMALRGPQATPYPFLPLDAMGAVMRSPLPTCAQRYDCIPGAPEPCERIQARDTRRREGAACITEPGT